MPDIKIKPKTTINNIDKARVGTERIKSRLIDIKKKQTSFLYMMISIQMK